MFYARFVLLIACHGENQLLIVTKPTLIIGPTGHLIVSVVTADVAVLLGIDLPSLPSVQTSVHQKIGRHTRENLQPRSHYRRLTS